MASTTRTKRKRTRLPADDKSVQTPVIQEATDEEWQAMVDEAARRYLGMSGEEFIRMWKAGTIDPNDPKTHNNVIQVGMLTGLPYGRE